MNSIVTDNLAVLSKGKVIEFVDRFGDDFKFTDHALNLEFTDKRRLIEFLEKSCELFPDTAVQVVSVFESGSAAIAEWNLVAAEHLSFGSMKVWSRISLAGVSIVQIENDKVTRWSDYYDKLESRRIGLAAHFTDWIEL